MKINIESLLQDNNINPPDDGKHARPGWINIECPFCVGNPGTHGGFNIAKSYYNCYRCGFHGLEKVVKEILSLNSYYEAKEVIKKYSVESLNEVVKNKPKTNNCNKTLNYPIGTGNLNKRHFEYLFSRGFIEPEKLVKEWSLKGTNHIGEYKFRIIAPIFYNYNLVSFQGRDITNKSNIKYKACSIENEIIHHKFLLYGLDKIKNKKCVLMEGIIDVWKFGIGAVSTFGIGFTKEQVALLINNRIEQVFILFDNDPQAQEKANKLAYYLTSFMKVEIIELNLNDMNDPGELDMVQALELRKELGF